MRGEGIPGKERKLRRGGAESGQRPAPPIFRKGRVMRDDGWLSVDEAARGRDAEKLRGAGVILLIAVGVAAVAVFAVPAAAWFLS